jgi:hypothetical protein
VGYGNWTGYASATLAQACAPSECSFTARWPTMAGRRHTNIEPGREAVPSGAMPASPRGTPLSAESGVDEMANEANETVGDLGTGVLEQPNATNGPPRRPIERRLPALAIVYGLSLGVLAVAALTSVRTSVPIAFFVRDPSVTLGGAHSPARYPTSGRWYGVWPPGSASSPGQFCRARKATTRCDHSCSGLA